MVIPAFAVNADQPQGVGSTLVPHPVPHGQDDTVTSGDSTESPQYLHCFLDNFFNIITFWLVMSRVDIAKQRHPAAAGCIGRKRIDRD